MLVVHHSGWGSDRSRNGSELPAAVDTEIKVVRQDGQRIVTLKCTKMKMAAHFNDIEFEMTEVNIGDGKSSVVLVPRTGGGSTRANVASLGKSGEDYQSTLAFARLVQSMGSPFASQVAEYQGLGTDAVNRYAKRVAERYGLIKVEPKVRDGSSFKNRFHACLDEAA